MPVLQTPVATSTSVTLNWVASTDNTLLAGYNVYRSGTKQNTSLITDTFFTQSGLTSNTNYGPYTVTAVDASGNESAPSNPQSVQTNVAAPDTVPPTVPTNLQLIPTNAGFQATWNPSTDVVGVSGYNVDVNSDQGREHHPDVLHRLRAGQRQRVQRQDLSLRCGRERVCSDCHQHRSCSTATTSTLFPPTRLAVVPGNGQLRMTWTPPASGTAPLGYNIDPRSQKKKKACSETVTRSSF